MHIFNRSDAQARADDIRVFNSELRRMEGDAVLTLSEEQRAAIAQYQDALLQTFAQQFDIDGNASARQLSLGMKISSFLGALALATSVFFLFYQFWGMLATPLQVVLLVGFSLASFGATIVIQGRDSSGYFAKLAAMVAFACFVLNIVMLGQIFNITPSDKALLPWSAFAFLLAYALDLRLLLVAAIACLVAFVAARVGTWGGTYWFDFCNRPENFFPAAALLLFIPTRLAHKNHAGFSQTYRVSGLLTLFLPILVLSHWAGGSYLVMDPDLLKGMYQVLGFFGTGVAIWLGARRQMGEVVNTGVTLFVIFLYTKLFDWWWDSMPKYLFFLVLGLIALLLLFIFRRLRGAMGQSVASGALA